MKKIAYILACLFIGTAHAATVEIGAYDSGWYTNAGVHNSTNQNYIAGNLSGEVYNNFLTFDLGSIANNVTSATLQLYTFEITGPGVYSLFDVLTPTATLTAGGSGLTGIYNDLGSGSSYGSISLASAQSNSIIQITLNASAISDINAASGGTFAIGGVYNGGGDYAFGFSDTHSANKLILNTGGSVPEPTQLLLFGLGLAVFGFLRNKQKAV